ncbi:MAG: hypothetical protein PF450_16175 [Bacteroidales bacterium]|jgi:hypothetical protein|nr:hypothetical protein [Bacteroidales bacterium]
MISASLIRDTFEYFAKFPELAGVLKSFNRPSGSKLYPTDYSDFKTKIESLDPNSLIPGIKDYVFGVNEDLAMNRIKEFRNFYLLVDYGSLSTDEDSEYKVKSDSFLMAVTVAIPLIQNSYDEVEALLLADQALTYLQQIRTQMISDKTCSLLKHIEFPSEITPFFSRELLNSIGFTMLFTKMGIGLLD